MSSGRQHGNSTGSRLADLQQFNKAAFASFSELRNSQMFVALLIVQQSIKVTLHVRNRNRQSQRPVGLKCALESRAINRSRSEPVSCLAAVTADRRPLHSNIARIFFLWQYEPQLSR